MSRPVDRIIIHCSASRWGCAKVIDSWHRDRGFDGIGYHYVITNGALYGDDPDQYAPVLDGQIEAGRNIERVGAHAEGNNRLTIGVCLVGVGGVAPRGTVTTPQLSALKSLVHWLMAEYDIPIEGVQGHYEQTPNHGKTCPDLPMGMLREYLMVDGSAEENGLIDKMREV